MTQTSQPDCFIDDYLVEMFSLFDKTRRQLGDVMNPVVVHMLL